MAFIPLQGASYIKKQTITAAFSVREKSGVGTLYISVPSTVAGKSWDKYERCSFAIGDGDDAGLLQIEAAVDGSFKIGRLRYALVFRVPAMAGWNTESFSGVICDVVKSDVSGYVLRLPAQLFATPAPKRLGAAHVATPKPGARPALSIVGTTIEHAGKAVKLTMPQFKLFQALWKVYGSGVSTAVIELALDGDYDLLKLVRTLDEDLRPVKLGICPNKAAGGYQLVNFG